MTVVLDAWAVLHLLAADDAAARRIALALEGRAVMSWLNLGEVSYVVERRFGPDAAAEAVRDLRPRLHLEEVSAERVLAAARLRAAVGCPYVDAVAAVTAIAHDAVLLTGDPDLLLPGAPWQWEDLRV